MYNTKLLKNFNSDLGNSLGKFHRILCSSIVRLTTKGDAHGYLYEIDLLNNNYKKVFELKSDSISFEGRGGDRGLRGVEFYKDVIIVGSCNEIIFLSKEYKFLESYTNKNLVDCHEICRSGDTLYITSTGNDSILEFDLLLKKFLKGYRIKQSNILSNISKFKRILMNLLPTKIFKISFVGKILKINDINYKMTVFDPQIDESLPNEDTLHINNVSFHERALFISGTGIPYMLKIEKDHLLKDANLFYKTHNAEPIDAETVIFNHTSRDRVVIANKNLKIQKEFHVKKYSNDLFKNDPNDDAVVRQGWARGLVLFNNLIIGGSSPATISVFNRRNSDRIKSINLSLDLREAIHGVVVIPHSQEHE